MLQRVANNGAKFWARALNYARGWRSPDNIIVIESDDWGSIRTSDVDAYEQLSARGYKMDRSCWSVDALETNSDLESLFEVLAEFRDARGNPACITGNMVMANPDFSAIRESNFLDYSVEPVAELMKEQPERNRVTALWNEGMTRKLFRPQYHSREHIRWWTWMEALRNGSKEALETFELEMCGLPKSVSKENQSFYEPPFVDVSFLDSDLVDLPRMIGEGIQLFKSQFGFRSLSTIAPNVAWTEDVEQVWATYGIKFIQGGFCQQIVAKSGTQLIPHYLGQRSRNGGLYLVRNCTFEPAKSDSEVYWKGTLAEIGRAFRRRIPAIITSHRVNFVGSVNEENRERSLSQLGRLLTAVKSSYPDTIFLSSAELGYMIENGLQRVRDIDGRDREIFPPVGDGPKGIECAKFD